MRPGSPREGGLRTVPRAMKRCALPGSRIVPRRALELALAAFGCLGVSGTKGHAGALSVQGVHVVPLVQSTGMRYRQETDFSLGSRVEVFLRNTAPETLVLPPTADIRLRGRTPEELLSADEWAWHDLPPAWDGAALRLPPGAITVSTWNGKRAPWGTGTQAEMAVTLPGAGGPDRLAVKINDPSVWLSAVTFLGAATNVQPDSMIFPVVNRTPGPLRLDACRLWLPENNANGGGKPVSPQDCWKALSPYAATRVRDPERGAGVAVLRRDL